MKPPKTKGVLVKRIAEAIEKDPENYIQARDSKVLDSIVKTLDMEKPPKKEVGKKILEEADHFGLENYFSSFSVDKLQEFAEDCGLEVQSSSNNQLIDCLCEQTDFKVKKKKKSQTVKPSKKKPDIKNGISKMDLNHYYYRNDLYDYCKEHGLNTTGNKKEFIQRILAHVEGRPQPPVKGKKKSKKKKNSKKSEESSKSDKSDSDSEEKSDEKSKTKSPEKGKEKTKEKEAKEKEKEKEKSKEKEKAKTKEKEKTAESPDEEGKGKKRKAEDSSSDSDKKKAKK
jgi:hypothetical protein